MQLRVLSYNIHKGFNSTNRSFTLSKIKEAIRSVSADLVFLQEVQGKHDLKANLYDSWPNVSQFEFLADQIWPHYAYGKNAIYNAGHHGNAILSKFPIVAWENVDISTNPFEQRGILHAEIELPESLERIHCFCLHLNILRRSRTSQIFEICKFVKKILPIGGRVLVAGDFNDWTHKASSVLEKELGAKELFKALHGRYAKSFPSMLPLLSLDRIYFKGFKPISAEVINRELWKDLSDHVPLLGLLDF